MTSCRRIQRRIMPFVDGKLDAGEQATVAAHVQGCPACGEEVAAARSLCNLLDRTPGGGAPAADVEDAIVRRIRAAGQQEEVATRGWLRWLVPVTAGLCTAGLAVYLTVGDGSPERATGPHGRETAATLDHPRASRERAERAERTAGDPIAGRAQTAGRPAAAPGSEDAAEQEAAPTLMAADDPPVELRDTLDLFVDFPIIDELDKFEHYDAIWSVTNEHSGRTRGG